MKLGRTAAFGLLFLIAIALGMLAYPMMVIQPFRHQGEGELKAALWVMRWRTYFEVAAVFAAIGLTAWYWRNAERVWPKALAAFGLAVVCGSAGLTRVNVYEVMFHRYDQPAFAKAAECKLDKDEMVIAILLKGQARAYPIRSMSYHHIVNDEVGGIPVAATY